jgi:hypothetical protein
MSPYFENYSELIEKQAKWPLYNKTDSTDRLLQVDYNPSKCVICPDIYIYISQLLFKWAYIHDLG